MISILYRLNESLYSNDSWFYTFDQDIYDDSYSAEKIKRYFGEEVFDTCIDNVKDALEILSKYMKKLKVIPLDARHHWQLRKRDIDVTFCDVSWEFWFLLPFEYDRDKGLVSQFLKGLAQEYRRNNKMVSMPKSDTVVVNLRHVQDRKDFRPNYLEPSITFSVSRNSYEPPGIWIVLNFTGSR